MPDIKLGTSTFNDIKVLQLYDVNNNLVRFYYEGLIAAHPQIGVEIIKYNKLPAITINPKSQVIITVSQEES